MNIDIIFQSSLFLPFKMICRTDYTQISFETGFHKHDLHQIVIVLEGTISFRMPGGKQISCHAGDFLMIPRGVPHFWKTETVPCRTIQCLHFPLTLEIFGDLCVWFGAQSSSPVFATPPPESFFPLVKRLENEILTENVAGSTLVHVLMLEVIILAIRSLDVSVLDQAIRDDTCLPVWRALHRIEKEFPKKFTVKELASEACMSVSRFAHLFREHIGISPLHYMNELRVERAAMLLTNSQRTISQIAEDTGFRSVYYFSRLFYRYRKMYPTQYRRMNLNH